MIFRFVSILGERYTHGHVFDFYTEATGGPDAAGGSRRRTAAKVLSVRSGLRRRHPLRALAAQERVISSISGPTNMSRFERFDCTIYGAIAGSIQNPVYRREPRVDRRQSVHLSRYAKDTIARLVAQTDDPRGRRNDGGLAGKKRLGVRAATLSARIGASGILEGRDRVRGVHDAEPLFHGDGRVC